MIIQYQHNHNTANITVHWLYSTNTIIIQQTLQYNDYTVPTQSKYSKHYSTMITQYQHNHNTANITVQWLYSTNTIIIKETLGVCGGYILEYLTIIKTRDRGGDCQAAALSNWDFKTHKFHRHNDIRHFMWFTLQPKSATEIGWWPVH